MKVITGPRLLALRGVSNVTLRAEYYGSLYNGSAHIVCTNTITIRCENVTNLTIDGLSFIVDIREGFSYVNSALHFINSSNISILSATFKGSGKGTGRAINLKNTSAIIQQCLFINHSAVGHGGAISLQESSLTISQCNFTDNEVLMFNGFGFRGALHASGMYTKSILLLNGRNQFSNNYAGLAGGAIFCSHCTIQVLR